MQIVSPLVGTVVAIKVGVGDEVYSGDEIVVIESMKMEHPVAVEHAAMIE